MISEKAKRLELNNDKDDCKSKPTSLAKRRGRGERKKNRISSKWLKEKTHTHTTQHLQIIRKKDIFKGFSVANI